MKNARIKTEKGNKQNFGRYVLFNHIASRIRWNRYFITGH